MPYSFAVDELYLICSIISEDHLRLFLWGPPPPRWEFKFRFLNCTVVLTFAFTRLT